MPTPSMMPRPEGAQLSGHALWEGGMKSSFSLVNHSNTSQSGGSVSILYYIECGKGQSVLSFECVTLRCDTASARVRKHVVGNFGKSTLAFHPSPGEIVPLWWVELSRGWELAGDRIREKHVGKQNNQVLVAHVSLVVPIGLSENSLQLFWMQIRPNCGSVRIVLMRVHIRFRY